MANVAHSTLTGSNLHENKGVSAASDDTVATAVSGATVWAKLDVDNLTGTGKAFQGQLYHTRYQKTSGTDGGALTSDAWTKYPLDTEVTTEITSATLTSSVISLPAGTYFADAELVLRQSAEAKLRLRDTTNSATKVLGVVNGVGITSGNGILTLKGRFALAGTANLELQYYAQTNNGSNALGASISAAGEVEVYGNLLIWKVG